MRPSAASVGAIAVAIAVVAAVPHAMNGRDSGREGAGGSVVAVAPDVAMPTVTATSDPARAANPDPPVTTSPTTVTPSVAASTVATTTSSGDATVAAGPRTGYTKQAAVSDANWILRAQLPDGAIATHVDHAHVVPYLANFAAIGLTRASAQTGDPRYTKAAWRYLHWYAAHQNARGFVTDYDATSGGRLRSTGDMDSTDAYAGTYLLAVRAAFRQSHDKAQLEKLRPSIRKAVAAIRSTQDTDGLTWAKPSWHVKYLMDQAETLAGLRAGTYLATKVGDASLRRTTTIASRRMQAGIDSLWNARTGSYDWAKHGNGVRIPTNWTRLYPDAMQQAWAVAFGAVPTKRAASLMRTFDARQPNWDRPTRTARFDSGTRSVGYWAPVGLALQRAGLASAGARGFRTIRSAALSQQRAWPFTPSDDGQLILLGNGALADIDP